MHKKPKKSGIHPVIPLFLQADNSLSCITFVKWIEKAAAICYIGMEKTNSGVWIA